MVSAFASTFRSFLENETSNQTGGTGWPSGNIHDFRTGLPEVSGSNPGGEEEMCLCIFTLQNSHSI